MKPADNASGRPVRADERAAAPSASAWGRRCLTLGCLAVVVAAALHSADSPIGGGDTWVAMACGRYSLGPWVAQQPNRTWQMRLLDRYGIHTTQRDFISPHSRPFDPASRRLSSLARRLVAVVKETATEKPQPLPAGSKNVGWINQNWLTHVLFYKMKTCLGGDPYQPQPGEFLIVLYKFTQAILTAVFAYWAARVLGAQPPWAAGATAFGMLLSRSFIDMRPNVSSIFFAIIMICLIAYWKRGRHRALIWFIPVTILWANVHGGFIYAIMVFGILAGGHVIQNGLGKYTIVVLCLAALFLAGLLFSGANRLGGEASKLGVRMNQARQSEALAGRVIRAEELRVWNQQSQALRFGQAAAAGAGVALVALGIFAAARAGRVSAEGWLRVGRRGLLWLVGALAAVVLIPGIFSPFGWENLIHPLVVATGQEGKDWRKVAEWRPIWEIDTFGNAAPYVCFLAVLAAVVAVWWVLFFLGPGTGPPSAKGRRGQPVAATGWPQMDLPQFGVMAVTIAMSVLSRRFIFLGGVALAPFLAALAQEAFTMIQWRRARRQSYATPSAAPAPRLVWIGAAGSWAAALLVTGVFGQFMWSKYLRPDQKPPRLTVFRRMVGIEDQPVELMGFFNKYHVRGVVFNEWSQGGFVAFHQGPDRQTGEPPCRLYIDGRAQAAYHLEHYQDTMKFKGDAQFDRNLDPRRLSQMLQQRGISAVLVSYLQSRRMFELLQQADDWLLAQGNGRHFLFLSLADPRNQETLELLRRDRAGGPPRGPRPPAAPAAPAK